VCVAGQETGGEAQTKLVPRLKPRSHDFTSVDVEGSLDVATTTSDDDGAATSLLAGVTSGTGMKRFHFKVPAPPGKSWNCVFKFSCTWNTQHTHPFNGPSSGTTGVSRYQKSKTNLGFTEARDREWQWHQLGHMQVCTSLQTDNHASTPPLSFLQARCPFCRPTNSVKALKAQDLESFGNLSARFWKVWKFAGQ